MSELLNKEQVAGLSVDDLLELDVDQLSEVMPFVPKPTGIYGFDVKACSLEEVGDGHAIVVQYTLTELIELQDEGQLEAVGELPCDYKENYFIGGESDYGLKVFRTIFAGVKQEGETVSIREMMERAVGTTGTGLLKLSRYKDKNSGEQRENNKWEPTAIDLN